MTLREFYTGVKEKTGDMSFSMMWEIKDLSSLCYYLSLVQLPEELLNEVGFIKNKKEFDEVFENFDPRKILHHGQYLSQLNYVLDYFVPEKITPYKKLTQTVFQTAKMLSKYRSADEFISEVNKECSEKDDKKTFEFLNSFRLQYALLPLPASIPESKALHLLLPAHVCAFSGQSHLWNFAAAAHHQSLADPLSDRQSPDQQIILRCRPYSFSFIPTLSSF